MSLDNRARCQDAFGHGGKLTEAAFGRVLLVGWDAVVATPPGDKRSVQRPKRLQDVFGYRVAGVAKPSGRAVRSVRVVCGFAQEQVRSGSPVEAANGLNRGFVWIGWAGTPIAVDLRICGGQVEKSRR